MKYAIFFSLLVCLAACKKSDPVPADTSGSPVGNQPVPATINMYVNDTFWQGTNPYAAISSASTISDTIFGLEATGANSTKLVLAFDILKTGRHRLLTNTSYTAHNYYAIDTGSITITSYNPVKKIIYGSYQFSSNFGSKKITVTKGYFSNVSVYY